jgi:hypothetical protein
MAACLHSFRQRSAVSPWGAGGESPELIRAIGNHYVPDKYFKCAYAKVAFVPMTKENIATQRSGAMH